jgi:hypothetical protein
MASDPTNQGILQKLGSFLRRRCRPRQTRLYGIGSPRSGTHSIAAIFDRSMRSRHEPAFRAATKNVLAHHRGLASFDELRRFVRTRDERLGLDVDSSHVNVFLIDALVAEFDDARFVLTIRDCFSWMDSAINHTMNSRRWSAADREYLEFWFDTKDVTYSRHDECLRQRGLSSIDCYLAAWSRHNDRALSSAPADRLLVVRTPEISARLHEIADFAGVSRERIDPGFRASGLARSKHGILEQVDAAYLADRVAAHCGALMSRFFPHVRSLRDALAIDAHGQPR